MRMRLLRRGWIWEDAGCGDSRTSKKAAAVIKVRDVESLNLLTAGRAGEEVGGNEFKRFPQLPKLFMHWCH